MISTPAGGARFTGRGKDLLVELPSIRVARALLETPLTSNRSARQRTSRSLESALDRSQVSIRIDLRGRRIAELGGGLRPSLLASLFGFTAVHLRLGALLAAVLSR